VTLVAQGKVRDIFDAGQDRLLLVATDRISAFDVILPTPIPDKGRVLTACSLFWFHRLESVVPNHLITGDPELFPPPYDEDPDLSGRATLARAADVIPMECVVRGYLAGSGWKEYQANGAVCGVPLPSGLRQAEQLPEPIFTPSTKAAVGDHDENIDFDTVVKTVGADLAEQVRDATLRLYTFARDYAAQRGILLADTKFEFGTDADGRLYVMDEMLTPDSSRYWPADEYQVGTSPPSYDKQIVRDYLETLDWDKRPPGPKLPAEVIDRTRARYAEALQKLAGISVD